MTKKKGQEKNKPFKFRIRKTCRTVSQISFDDGKRLTTTGISENEANANQMIHWNELSIRREIGKTF